MNSNVTVRRMSVHDIEEVVAIEQECFSLPWSKDAFAESMEQPYAVFFVAEYTDDNKTIAGYVGVYHIGDECDITNIAVLPRFRRKGIAKMLLGAVEEYASSKDVYSVTLEVRESNTSAISLYDMMQYENIGMRKNFYEKPTENAIIMVRRLK